ncbi:hypothetical protein [Hoeflea ulvae]|uniref:Uncharacterized protein n=1 Tax=Hoeflea ulvae TaxID=2983764 RepID=A0ABT3YJP4_9HYPH|nr:hypothetical protein [Hoeflea ulvae]MCY0096116.1 hypothetical protein [Hoeflea ulvae]
MDFLVEARAGVAGFGVDALLADARVGGCVLWERLVLAREVTDLARGGHGGVR